jgi:hypothetical protein
MVFTLLTMLLSTQTPSNALAFEKEKIRIIVLGDECILRGDYHFKNNSSSPCDRTLYYPFVLRDDLPFPHMISVTDLYDGATIPFSTSEKGITFRISLPPFATKAVLVEYHQKCKSNRFDYVLTTTSHWQKPLKSAEFLVSLPSHLALDSISIPFDTLRVTSDAREYLVRRTDFIPSEDLSITWRIRK